MTTREIPLAEAERRLSELVAAVEATGEPYVITAAGQPSAVLTRYGNHAPGAAPSESGYAHITRVAGISGGEPIIRGTRISVRHIVECVRAGESVEAILQAHSHLIASQVHAALAYYYDHTAEIERLIEEARPERVAAQLGLVKTRIADGIYEIHHKSSRW